MSFFGLSFHDIGAYLSELNVVSVAFRLILALVFSGIIGFERKKRRRAAGFRTYMLVCVGAALAMMTDQYIYESMGGSSPTRMAAQVISGIGFLGAGTILVTGRQQVKGLTTAAGLWASACVGIALGAGFYVGAVAGFICLLLVVMILHKVDSVLEKRSSGLDLYVEVEDIGIVKELSHYFKENGISYEYQQFDKIQHNSGIGVIAVLDVGRDKNPDDVLEDISGLKGVRYTEELH